MKHRLQGDKKTPASDGRMPGLTKVNSLGGILGCKMAFYALFPTAVRHKAVVARILWNGGMDIARRILESNECAAKMEYRLAGGVQID